MSNSHKRPLDQGDDAGVPAGASGPDTEIPSASPSETGALDGGDHSRDLAGASRPDTETHPDVSSSPVPASGALSLLGKQLPPVPSSTLRTSLDTEVPMEQRLQDPVTYSFAQDGNKGICFAMGVCKQLGVLKAVPSRVTDPPKECTTTV